MSDEKALAIQQNTAPEAWGERAEIDAIAKRLRTMLPNGAKLNDGQLYAAGQYAKLTGLDPFTGGFTAMPDGGIFDGYKTLVAWAQSKELYTDKYYSMTAEELAEEGYSDVIAGWKCYLIRWSQQAILLGYLQAGFPLPDALEMVVTKGIGVVSKKDTQNKSGQEIAPHAPGHGTESPRSGRCVMLSVWATVNPPSPNWPPWASGRRLKAGRSCQRRPYHALPSSAPLPAR